MEITIELDDSDMALLFSYYCHRNGYMPVEFMFKQFDENGSERVDHKEIVKLEALFDKMTEAVGYDVFEDFEGMLKRFGI